ncbi:MAG TPA: CHAT domain-containing protein, partial [Thermoanaerobaculia bacterium]|nr:CHAT domain-containing protein [Thermoanaerobaculia bacterium]
LGSLWSVDDKATAHLMDRFYRELLVHGRPPSEALRLAQLSLRSEKQWRSPYYWGGFVLQGDGLNNARSSGSP